MRHAICRLTFSTAARFGSDAGGASLTDASMSFRADVLFSALFQALMPLGQADALLEAARSGALSFSDGLPWRRDALFLPRPAGLFERPGDARSEDPSRRKLLLSAALPGERELSGALDGAYYTVVRRGGFVSSGQSMPFKKRTATLLGAGSTFRRRFHGQILDVGIDMPHPVWRYAMPMFMGVRP